MMPSQERLSRIGGIGAILGVGVLFAATMLHPMNAHPADAPAAFAEYALDNKWVATHLSQFLGMILMAAGFIALSWKLRAGRAGVWALFAGAAAVVSVALGAALQAVDGVALKFMVDRWASAPAETRALVFEAAVGVRQIEIGLASLLEALFGLTVFLYGVALLLSPVGAVWLGIFGVFAGVATVVSGVVHGHVGFSDMGMMIGMPSTMLALLWSVCVGVFLIRRKN